jgi:hypothetical protein
MRNAALPDISRYNNIFPAGHANFVIFFISVLNIPVSNVIFLACDLKFGEIIIVSYKIRGYMPGKFERSRETRFKIWITCKKANMPFLFKRLVIAFYD